MPAQIGRDEVQRLIREGAQVVEVLPAEMHRKEHVPGAISIPLTKMSRAAAERLDRHRPVIVYCYDLQCDLSARAAWVLESFGFEPTGHPAAQFAAFIATESQKNARIVRDAKIRAE